MIPEITNRIPGLQLFRTYKREWLSHDVLAGVSVAAVALPIGIAYAQLAGFPPVIGIYSCILPAIAYAIFGTSRQLVVNPDSAACMIVAATIVPLAGGDPQRYLDLSIMLAFLTGLFCIIGGFLHFGVIANFFSRPILTGYLNGIALSIIASQIGTLLGFKIPSGGFFRTLWGAISNLNETHYYTLFLGLALFALIWLLKRFLPQIPAPLVAAIAGIAVVYFGGLQSLGVAVVGEVPAGFLTPRIPSVETSQLSSLAFGALGIVLVSFTSMMATARSFAARYGYGINVNQDMLALGISDMASAISGGFVVSGADSRTAVADASGGKTQVATIIAAVSMALVLLFLTKPLAYVPSAALAAILIASAMGLFDIASLRHYYQVSKIEFRHAIIAMLGVMTIGVLPGILVAVGLALFKLLQFSSRPHDAILGLVDEKQGIYGSVQENETGQLPGLLIYRFDSSLLFFNADYFKDRVNQIIQQAREKPAWFILDAEAIPLLDVTGSEALQELQEKLGKQGISLAITRPKGFFKIMLARSGLAEKLGPDRIFPSVHAAVQAFQKSSNTASETANSG